MKIVFMGTPGFAIPSLEALALKHDVAAVVTQPDKPAGRGSRLTRPPVKECALGLGIPVHQPASIKQAEVLAELAEYGADVFVVAAYGQILPKTLLTLPTHGCINIHASLLPKYRGAAPIQQAIINGDIRTGITIMQMDTGMDTGDILLKQETEIHPQDTAGSLYPRLAEIGAQAILETLRLLEEGGLSAQKQDDSQACYAPRITKENTRIAWDADAVAITNLVRGLCPAPAAWTTQEGETFKIHEAQALAYTHDVLPGSILHADTTRGIIVAAGNEAVRLKQLQKAGGRCLGDAQFLNGNRMLPGNIFR